MPRYAPPAGRIVKGWTVTLEPAPEQAAKFLRDCGARLLSAVIRERAGRWSVSLRLEITAPWRPGPRTSTVGADVGIGNNLLIVMRADGTVAEKVPNPKALWVSLTELRRANRALARKKEGSPRWVEAKRKLGRVHARVSGIRSDAIHKATTHLAKTHGQVVIDAVKRVNHLGKVAA